MSSRNIFLIVFLMINITVFAQRKYLSGNVLDNKSKKPIVGATIRIQETNIGTVTNSDGDFSFGISPNDLQSTVEISFVGYKTKEMKATDFIRFETIYLIPEKSDARLDESVSENYSASTNQRINQNVSHKSGKSTYLEGDLPVNKYNDNFSFKSINEYLTNKIIELSVGYHTTNFTNGNFATNIQNGSLNNDFGLEGSWTILQYSPLIVDASAFVDWYSTSIGTKFHHSGLKLSGSFVLFPCGKLFIPYGGLGAQLSCLNNDDYSLTTGTSNVFWKTGIKSFLFNDYPISIEYSQSLFTISKSENQLKVSIGISLTE